MSDMKVKCKLNINTDDSSQFHANISAIPTIVNQKMNRS